MTRAKKPTDNSSAKVKIPDIALGMFPSKKSPPRDIFSTASHYAPYEPPKGVLPKSISAHGLAMDNGFDFNLLDLAGINTAIGQGYSFPGFSLLAEWSQISEFRKPAEVLSREITRKWIKLSGDDQDKIDQIEKEFKRLNVQHVFRKAVQDEGLFGRAQIFLDMGDDKNTDELKTPLNIDSNKVGKGSLKRLTVIEPLWSYPSRYDASNPIDPTFYKPVSWYVMGTEIHNSRLLTMVTRPVPDILKPSYAFAGLSLSQLIKPYVDNWLRTRQSVSDIIHAYTVWVLATDLTQIVSLGGAQEFYNRLKLFNDARDNHGINAIDKNSEEFSNVSANLAGLDKLQAQAQEHMSAPTGIPLVYMTGITPSGLNATSDGEIEVFQDTVHAIQELLTPNLSKILDVVQLSLFGEIDESVGFEWQPLKVTSAKEEVEIRKMDVETDVGLIDAGVLSPTEVRTKLTTEPGSPYANLDPDEEIVPPDTDSDESGSFHIKSFGGNS